MSTTAVFLNIEKAFDKTWQLGLLYKLSELKYAISLINLSFFRENSEFRPKVNCLHQGIYNRGSHKVTSCPPHFTVYIQMIHVRWVPCHLGMARPQVADGGDCLQFWRVTEVKIDDIKDRFYEELERVFFINSRSTI
jgi:hypothetical protein